MLKNIWVNGYSYINRYTCVPVFLYWGIHQHTTQWYRWAALDTINMDQSHPNFKQKKKKLSLKRRWCQSIYTEFNI